MFDKDTLVYQWHFMPIIMFQLCINFQDMYDLILDYGCRCTSHCAKPLTDVVNKMGFTPLTLAAKLARRQVNVLLECFQRKVINFSFKSF